MEEIKGKIKLFLSKVLRNRELADDESIFDNGAVNSLFAIQLILFLEKEFKIRIENNDMDMENFKTVNSIASLIEAKIA